MLYVILTIVKPLKDNKMKVKDLIEHLQTVDPNAEVLIHQFDVHWENYLYSVGIAVNHDQQAAQKEVWLIKGLLVKEGQT